MSVFLMIFRKMRNNGWLVGSLFIGLLISVALVSSIPVYTSGTLQHLLIKELENYQLKEGKYPGRLYEFAILKDEKKLSKEQKLNKMESYFDKDVIQQAGLPLITNVTNLNTDKLLVKPQDTKKYNPDDYDNYMQISSFSDINNHIKLTDGRLPKKQLVDGVYEALVTENALAKQDFVLGMTLKLQNSKNDPPILIKPVGIFKPKENSSSYWMGSLSSYSDSFIIPESLFRKTFVEGKNKAFLHSAERYATYDYHEIQLNDINRLLGIPSNLKKDSSYLFGNEIMSVDFPIADILKVYIERESQLKTMLWSLQVPVLILMGLYLFMVSRLIINRQQAEIAVLRSRGAGRPQIFLSYFIEFVILGTIAFLIAPYIGLFIAKMLGASSGFLQFVQRVGLPVHLTLESYEYAGLALIGGLIMMLIPVMQATRETIVSQKRKVSRFMGMAVWHKFFIDFLFLAIAGYGWYVYNNRLGHQSVSTSSDLLQIDPLLFFVPILFVIGLGLFCLRFYPYLLRLVNFLGRKLWPTSMYLANSQVGRAAIQYQFVMLFLIVTIGIGVLSVSEARTINKNMEERLRYTNGADIQLQVKWDTTLPKSSMSGGGAPQGQGADPADNAKNTQDVSVGHPQYIEPPFETFTKLSGVEHAAKVFQKDNLFVKGNGQTADGVEIMGINPRDFGETAWFKQTLLPYHINAYLNLIAKEPSAVLVSRSLAESLNVKPGDKVNIDGNDGSQIQFWVYGIIDYWPSWNPRLDSDSSDSNNQTPMLIVANLPYIQNTMGLEPYDVWLKLKPNASTEMLYKDIEKMKVPILSLKNADQDVIKMKNDPFLQGLNGALTLGFLISIIVTFIGFLLHWILTLFSRSHQYGIFRAMGLSLSQLIGMMIWEQILTSGVACFLGILAGSLASRLFVPLIQLVLYGGGQVPPFSVMIQERDAGTIYIFIITMILIGLSILGVLLGRLRIHQAIKLGED